MNISTPARIELRVITADYELVISGACALATIEYTPTVLESFSSMNGVRKRDLVTIASQLFHVVLADVSPDESPTLTMRRPENAQMPTKDGSKLIIPSTASGNVLVGKGFTIFGDDEPDDDPYFAEVPTTTVKPDAPEPPPSKGRFGGLIFDEEEKK